MANSVVAGGTEGKNHWTLSTKSECEEDRATKFSLHLKKIKKLTSSSLRDLKKEIAAIEMKTKLEA